MSELVLTPEAPKTINLSAYDFIDDYTPPRLIPSPGGHTRQRSLTTTLPTEHSLGHSPPKRQNSLKRITRMALATSSTSDNKKNKASKSSQLTRASTFTTMAIDIPDNNNNNHHEYSSSYNENIGNNIIDNGQGGKASLRQKPSPLLTAVFHKPAAGGSGGGSLPLFPSVKESEEFTVKIGTTRLVIEGHVFGCKLPELLVKETKISRGDQKIFIPYLIENCVATLLKEDVLKQEGIFRQSGRLIDNQLMKTFYDKGKYLNLEEYPDSYTVAALLKLYLRELPEPLIPPSLYDPFLEIGKLITSGKEVPVQELKDLIKSLPMVNKSILKILMALLSKAAQLEPVNKMGPGNLAIVIGPNIMWTDKHTCPADVVHDQPAINQLSALLISHYEEYFDADEDTKNITLDNLCQQHNALTIKFPSFAEVKAEEEKAQQQAQLNSKKKNFIEKALSKII